MWPNQGPPPMVPGYNPAYPSVPPTGVFLPQGQYPGYPADQYPVMGPVAPGVMPYNVPGSYPVATGGCTVVTDGRAVVTDGRTVVTDGCAVVTPGAPCVIIEEDHHHRGGLSRMANALAGRMEEFEYKVHKKMKKARKHGYYKHGKCSGSSSSSSSDCD